MGSTMVMYGSARIPPPEATEEALAGVLRPVPGRTAHELVKHARPRIAKLIERGGLVAHLDDPRAYLFRCAHNAAIDRLRRFDNKSATRILK